MELRHIRYFLVVAEEQNFTRAAAELGMTERAVEGRLYRLKKRLRTMLGGDGNA